MQRSLRRMAHMLTPWHRIKSGSVMQKAHEQCQGVCAFSTCALL